MSSRFIQSPMTEGRDKDIELDLGTISAATGNSRVKAPPVCVDATLIQEAMSTEELAKLSFPLEISPKSSISHLVDHEPSVVSSSSSTASRESAFSDQEGKHIPSTPIRLERRQSSQINLKVTNQKISRSGRESQRWFTDPATQRVYRMVTGCVPIVEGGRILFVSASRKPEWIIPKGGWEKDEKMEESAIRECFEEAGVLGVLGPRLKDFDYETRKAKKRRLEYEECQKKLKTRVPPSSSQIEAGNEPQIEAKRKSGSIAEVLVTTSSPTSSQIEAGNEPQIGAKPKSGSTAELLVTTGEKSPKTPKPLKLQSSDEKSSVASDSMLSHTHIRLSLYVLYVSEVKSHWPESGRSRKVVDIGEAIKMCESRPEFLTALKEVKERNLHHLPEKEKYRSENR
ncbi:unnamed protein product [Cylindrotheca closterium]|uniref:Nudix hydrolase domain-containing protein n=1 Tax=Cylindrotheca closterium TaxID=2856 RepID=A0AAD2FTV6_9STRA|nr:unnamed protein product [Cylindrotheca closterium]